MGVTENPDLLKEQNHDTVCAGAPFSRFGDELEGCSYIVMDESSSAPQQRGGEDGGDQGHTFALAFQAGYRQL